MRRLAYYYLAASLPAPHLGEEPAISESDFLEECLYQVTPPEYGYIKGARLRVQARGEEVEHEHTERAAYGAALLQWWEYAAGLQGDMARVRSESLGVEALVEWHFSDSVYVHDTAHDAIEAPHPLAAEEMINGIQWHLLQDMSDYFSVGSVDWLYTYSLQVQLAWRVWYLRSAEGVTHYNRYYETARAQLDYEGFKQ